MQSALVDCMRVGGDAINLENMHRNYEAYRKYLFCCVKAFTALTEEINDMKRENFTQRLKLAKLANDCAGRIVDFCSNPDMTVSRPQSLGVRRTNSAASSPSSPSQRRSPAPDAQKALSSPTISSTQSQLAALNIDKDDPEVQAKIRNQILIEQHRRLMENPKYTATRKANMALSLHKKILENMEIAKKEKSHLTERLLERYLQLKAMADSRITAMNSSDTTKQKEHNELLTSILVHDDKHKWPVSLKSKLTSAEGLNTEHANDFCVKVLRSGTHPLGKLMRETQQRVKLITQPLYDKYSQLVSDCVSVPYLYADTELSEEAIAEIEENITDDLDNTFEANCDATSDQIKTAIYKTDKTIDILESGEKLVTGDAACSNGAMGGGEVEDDMDYLFDSDDDDIINTEQCDSGADSGADSSAANHRQNPANKLFSQTTNNSSAKEITKNELKEVLTFSKAFTRQLKILTEDIRETMHSLSTLLRLAYDDFACPQGCDIVNAKIQDCLFEDVAEGIQLLYRLANLENEMLLAQVMTKLKGEDISSMQVKEKWYLDTRGECYDHLVTLLQTIINIPSPIQKISCAVKVNNGVVNTTSAFYQARGTHEPIGADDLVPIICFIVIRSCLPHIISQCAIMEEFMPSDYMMGEEGYTLATVLTAVQSLLKL